MPGDEWLNGQQPRISVGARELCSRIGQHPHGFRKSSESLRRPSGLRVSPERLRQIVESEGRRRRLGRGYRERCKVLKLTVFYDQDKEYRWVRPPAVPERSAASYAARVGVWGWRAPTRCWMKPPASQSRPVPGPSETPCGVCDHTLGERVAMVDYPTCRAQGWDIGGGPTEAQCKTMPARLKGSGMRWAPPNADAMLALTGLTDSDEWPAYWHSQGAQWD